MSLSPLIALVAAAVLAGGPPPAGASPVPRGGVLAPPVAITMDQAVRLVERRFRARVVRAETRRQAGRTIYVLRLLDGAGRVFTVRVDASSGQIS